jgi:S1-C subfamily serine protease
MSRNAREVTVPTFIHCPTCGQEGQIRDGVSTAAVKCPACGTVIGLGSPRGAKPARAHGRSKASPSKPFLSSLAVGGGVASLLMIGLVWLALALWNRGPAVEPSDSASPSPSSSALRTIAVIAKEHSDALKEARSAAAPDPAAARSNETRAPINKAPEARAPVDRTPPPIAPPGRVLSTAEIVARCEPSVALVRGKVSSGTGFLVRPDLLATNAHVIDDEFIQNIEIRFPSADESHKGPIRAELVYENPKRDLAFLRLSPDLPALEVASSYRYMKGEDVIAIGSPGIDTKKVLENAVSRGVMSSKTTFDGQSFYQLGMAVNPGNSGGPVFDSQGRVIGVVTLKSTDKESLSFCIPVEDLDAAIRMVERQPTETGEKAQSKHRIDLAFRMLSSAGAMFASALAVQSAIFGQSPGMMTQPRTGDYQKFDAQVRGIDTALFAGLPGEATRIRLDSSAGAAPALHGPFSEMASNYTAMKALFDRPGADVNKFNDRVRELKAKHLAVVLRVKKSLRMEVPEKILAALQPNSGDDAAVVMGDAVPDLRSIRPDQRGRFTFGPPPSLRERYGLGPRIGPSTRIPMPGRRR